MNAALQCLSNTMAFQDYFLGDGIEQPAFIKDLRPDNRDASKACEVTVQFAKFLNSMWNKEQVGSYSWEKDVFSPGDLKRAIARKNCLFEGYS